MVRQSDSIAKLAAALVKAQAEVQHATKDAKNPHFRSDYASLTSVLDTIKPVFAAHGLALVQFPGFADGHATLDTVLVHESGEWMAATAGAPLQKNDPQGVGSALTYLRRYSGAAVAGIGQEDDDGNAASKAPKRSAEAEALVREVRDLLGQRDASTPEAGIQAAVEAIDTRDVPRLRAAVAWLKDNIKVPA